VEIRSTVSMTVEVSER